MVQPVDPTKYRPRWLQVVDQLRHLIADGRYEPGDRLPNIEDLAHQAEVSKGTIRRALDALVAEQLIATEQGSRAEVVAPRERIVEKVRLGDHIKYRPATPDEQRRHGLAEGADVAEVTGPDGAVKVFPARAVEFVVDGDR
jgi:DNA-binding GntR family transcriptional regulator